MRWSQEVALIIEVAKVVGQHLKGTQKNVCFSCASKAVIGERTTPSLKKDRVGRGNDVAHVGIASRGGSEDDVSNGDILTASSSFETSDSWLLDSGCSQHMTPDRSPFATYVPAVGKSFPDGE